MRHLYTFVAATVLATSSSLSHANEVEQNYPSRPIKLIVPYAAGGAVDMVGRVYAQKLTELTGQPVVVENRPGGSAMIGIKAVQQAPSDGYTLLMSTTTFSTNTIIYKTPGYVIEDFTVVAGLGVSGLVLVANKNVPFKNYAELVAYAKTNPKKVNMGVLGGGGITQLLTSRFQNSTGLQMTEVPYKGGSLAMQDLLAGTIDLYIDPMPTVIPQLSGGRLLPIASTTDGRSPLAPDVPTFKEVGVPEMIGGAWFAVHASAKTPKLILEKMRQQNATIMKSKDFNEKLISVKIDPWEGTLEGFNTYLKSDKALWEKDAQRSGLTGSL